MRQLKQLKLINLDRCPSFADEDYIWMNDKDYMWVFDENYVWTDSDLYSPTDDRVWKSNIEDIEGGDNFVDFCTEFYKILDEEDYFEN